MTYEKKLSVFINGFLCILLIICFFQTSQLLKRHFTHIDDIGVAESLLIRNLDYRDNCSKINQSDIPILVAKIFTKDLEKICRLNASMNRLSLVSSLWTYAPFQFYTTQALLNRTKGYDYDEIKLLGRLPSYIFYVIGVCSFLLLISKVFEREKFSSFILWMPITIVAFSLEQRIYAAQMESYSIGLLSNCLAIWCLCSVHRVSERSYLQLIAFSAILAVSISMQYQAILLVSSGLIAIGLFNLPNIFKFSYLNKFSLLTISTVLFSYCIVGNVLGFSNRALNWNIGISGEFAVKGTTFSGRVLNFLKVIFSNAPYNFYSIISGLELPLQLANYFGFFFLIFFLLGLYNLGKHRKEFAYFFWLSNVYILVYLLFVFLGKLTFSPTRHFLYYLPFIAIICGFGFQLIFQLPKRQLKSIQVIFGTLLIAYCLTSIYSFHSFESQRQDLLNENIFPPELVKANASFLLYDQFDIEPLLIRNLKTFPIYQLSIPEAQCNGFSIYSPRNNEIQFLTYSKRRSEWDLADPYFRNFLDSLIGNCFIPHTKNNIVSIQKVGDLLKVGNNTEIDLSNKTKNGSNSYYIQIFSAKLKIGSDPSIGTVASDIDFRKHQFPQFVSYTSGIAQSEGWGRWTDSSTGPAIIGLREPLLKSFVIELEATAFGPNGEGETRIRIGNQSKSLLISSGKPKSYRIEFDNVEAGTTILIEPPSPISPSPLDPRKLGIGLVNISFIPKS
jgi:hypothetical protein